MLHCTKKIFGRLLQLMKKGVSVDQVARVTRAFTDAGILVHAYLM